MTASQLVPVVPGTIGNTQCLTIDGRTLHGVLGVRRDFSTWMKGRISKYGFVQGQDFEVFTRTGENSELDSPNLGNQKNHGGDRRSIEYRCTLGMGKELCMVENNEQGRVARRYFIECERRLLSAPAPQPTADGPLTPALRAELKAIVDAKLSTAPTDVQGKARAEIWTRFNRHFKIAEYAQLPACRMAEARDYLIELQMKSYPTKTAAAVPANAEQEIETHCAAMRGLVRQLNVHMDEIFNIARKGRPDLRTPGDRRELALASIYSMEDAAGAIGHSIAILERTAKTTLIAARM